MALYYRSSVTVACHAWGAGVTQIDRVVEAVEETLKGNTVQMLAKKALPRLDLPKVRPGAQTVSCRPLCATYCTLNLGPALPRLDPPKVQPGA